MDDQVQHFGDIAKGLAHNPLGIISLFIVLVYGFASLVTAFGGSFTAAERLPLIWFLILFPKNEVKIAQKIQNEVEYIQANLDETKVPIRIIPENDIYSALLGISEELANSYLQVISDLQRTDRLSWAGTAHEIREILATLIRELASDDNVCLQSWFKQDPNTSGPTQRQRIKYIVQKNQAGSKEKKVVEQVDMLDERIANFVRLTYTRASDAAHRYKPKQEVSRIQKYFKAFAFDLLNL